MLLAIALNNFQKLSPFSIIQDYSMQLFINQNRLSVRANNLRVRKVASDSEQKNKSICFLLQWNKKAYYLIY